MNATKQRRQDIHAALRPRRGVQAGASPTHTHAKTHRVEVLCDLLGVDAAQRQELNGKHQQRVDEQAAPARLQPQQRPVQRLRQGRAGQGHGRCRIPCNALERGPGQQAQGTRARGQASRRDVVQSAGSGAARRGAAAGRSCFAAALVTMVGRRAYVGALETHLQAQQLSARRHHEEPKGAGQDDGLRARTRTRARTRQRQRCIAVRLRGPRDGTPRPCGLGAAAWQGTMRPQLRTRPTGQVRGPGQARAPSCRCC